MSGSHYRNVNSNKGCRKVRFLCLLLWILYKSCPHRFCGISLRGCKFLFFASEMYVFISGSNVNHNRLLIRIKITGSIPRVVQRLSDTRWACRYFASKNIVDRLVALARVIDEISYKDNPDRTVEVGGLLA